MRHEEHIIDYLVDDAPNYEYYDNHGMIVRCRDCVHYRELNYCYHLNRHKPNDWYCADGERKIEELKDRICIEHGGQCKHEPHQHCPNEHVEACGEYQCPLCKAETFAKEAVDNE